MSPILPLLLLSVIVSGPARALHEAPVHDPDAGLNAWSAKRFAVTRPKLHKWLDSRHSYTNKYRFAAEVAALLPKWVPETWRERIGNLFLGPLVCFTDAWHLSYTITNIAGNCALFLALLSGDAWSMVAAASIVFVEDALFEPTYRLLRRYKG